MVSAAGGDDDVRRRYEQLAAAGGDMRTAAGTACDWPAGWVYRPLMFDTICGDRGMPGTLINVLPVFK